MRSYFFSFLVLSAALFIAAPSAVAQKARVRLAIFQDGVEVIPKKGVFTLEKTPFSIRLRVKNADGVYLNTSTVPSYYSLGKSQAVPELEFIQFQTYAEYEFNEKKLLYIDSEGFSFLGYDPGVKTHRFNVLTPTKKGFEGYRVVQRLHFLDSDKIVEIADVNQDLYLFLIATTGYAAVPANEELLRRKYQIVWKD
ncbi:MAG: hypothetical protein KDC34_09670 [Saprospiraceae bacterium]|nr:hypothetical protein [Saprospiraceae bacterium]